MGFVPSSVGLGVPVCARACCGHWASSVVQTLPWPLCPPPELSRSILWGRHLSLANLSGFSPGDIALNTAFQLNEKRGETGLITVLSQRTPVCDRRNSGACSVLSVTCFRTKAHVRPVHSWQEPAFAGLSAQGLAVMHCSWEAQTRLPIRSRCSCGDTAASPRTAGCSR